MSAKPITTQACNTQACTQSYTLPYNSGWGGTTQLSFEAATLPKSININGSCDDWAIIWLNGTVVYNPGGCSCGGSCCAGINFTRSDLLRVGTNTVTFRCNDACGGSSGGRINLSINY